jgi:serine/threonine-protein kinase HipA
MRGPGIRPAVAFSLGKLFLFFVKDRARCSPTRLVIERVTGRMDLTELDYLPESPKDRAGALSFGRGVAPPAPVRDYNRIVLLDELREAARIIEAGASTEDVPEQVRQVLEPTTSMGGARPKNTVEDEDGLCVAKFPAKGDRWNSAAVRMASALTMLDAEDSPTTG